MKKVQIFLPEGCQIKTQESLDFVCETYKESVFSTDFWKNLVDCLIEEYVFVVTKSCAIDFVPDALKRFLNVAETTSSTMLYSDYRVAKEDAIMLYSTIDYQEGSVRDDFDFGSVLLFNISAETFKSNVVVIGIFKLKLFPCEMASLIFFII